MAKVLWGVDPLAASRLGQEQNEPHFTKKELARIGIPAHKIDRVQAELARLAADKTLTRAELTQLAKKVAAVLLQTVRIACWEGRMVCACGPMRASAPTGKIAPLFRQTALSPAPYYGIMAISCRKTSGAVGKNRFVWQPAMRKEFMYEEQ